MRNEIQPIYPRPSEDRVAVAKLQIAYVAEYVAPGSGIDVSVLIRALLARGITVAASQWAIHDLNIEEAFSLTSLGDFKGHVATRNQTPAGLELSKGTLHINSEKASWSFIVVVLNHEHLHQMKCDSSIATLPFVANARKLFPKGIPKSANIIDLVVRIDAERGSGRSMKEIAREFTDGDAKQAESLLAQIRRLKREGRVNL